MGSLLRDLGIYLLGGVTFIPLTLLAIFIHGWLTFGRIQDELAAAKDADLLEQSDDGHNARRGSEVSDQKLQRGQDKEHAGYFAVCREWVPGGMSSKPPERTTPVGDVVGEESPSVYQSMYRSLFDRKHGSTMEISRPNGRSMRRGNNIFYVVIRHGHLMLYDDSEQVEVRYVISLAQHDITVFGGDMQIPEGELWIKRNAIRLSRKASLSESLEAISKPFFLFSDNCSEKENFYFALLQNQERDGKDIHPAPLVQQYETKHIIGLVQRLHSSEEQLQTRWFNALLGRLFLGVYKTPELEEFLRLKIMKKISRVNKPGFLSNIVLRKIDLGEAAPLVTNPRLKDLTVDGECCAEADLKYEGKFRIEVGASARINLGTRFKAREVNFVLAITVKKVEGHVFLRFKPPPSNRIWYAFEKMPNLDLQIEPIVSSRQITYNIILRAIESRIREVFAETLVVPQWDDTPFFHTEDRFHRGGIWVNEKRDFQPPTETIVPDEDHHENEDSVDAVLDVPASHTDDGKPLSPALPPEGQKQRVFSWKSNKSTPSLPHQPETGVATSTSFQKSAEPPKVIRSKQFSAAAGPVTSTDNANRDPVVQDKKNKKKSKDAASVMSEISSRSQPTSPSATIDGPILDDANVVAHEDTAEPRTTSTHSSEQHMEETESKSSEESEQKVPAASNRSAGASSDPAGHSTRLQTLAKTFTPSQQKQQSLGAAALAAKNWGWKTISKSKPQMQPSRSTNERLGTPDNPIGRGQPLPPPGQPLPLPDNKRSTSFQLSAKKGQPPKLLQQPREGQNGILAAGTEEQNPPRSAPPPETDTQAPKTTPRRKEFEDLLVVAAPADSGPPTPAAADEDEYGDYMVSVRPNDADSPLKERLEKSTDGMSHEQDAENLQDEPTEASDTRNTENEHVLEGQKLSAGQGHERPTPLPAEPFDIGQDVKTTDESEFPSLEREPERSLLETRKVERGVDENEDHPLSPWKSAQDEEERSRGIWTEEPEIPIA